MIISRTPFRISFLGGGTDYPGWYKHNPGAVLSTTIDKYCYLTCRYLPPFFEHSSRIVWSQIERVSNNSLIVHPSVRECLAFLGIVEGVEIHHDGDLPARAGLGSSSSFTVGLINALSSLIGEPVDKKELAGKALYVEQQRILENVGSQDQIAAAYGGLNRIDFLGENDFSVTPMIIDKGTLKLFEEHLLLVFTGFSRTASEIAKEQIKVMSDKKTELLAMYEAVDEGIALLNDPDNFLDFGRLLHDTWLIKKSLTPDITTVTIDYIYNRAIAAGALGGKLLGAGGGGFMLFFVEPDRRSHVSGVLADFLQVPFKFEKLGSQVIFRDNMDYSTFQNSGIQI